jgi:integrase
MFTVKLGSIRSAFLIAVQKAKACSPEGMLQNLRFHDLRHEAVSRLFEKGLNTFEVGSISGHKTLAMLQRYTHFKANDLALKIG